MDNKKKKSIIINNNLSKVKGNNIISKSTKERKIYNNIQKNSSRVFNLNKRNNIIINNRFQNFNNNKEITTITTIQNLPYKKDKNSIANYFEIKNKKDKKDNNNNNKEYNFLKPKKLNILEPNTFSEDYFINRYKMTNFSDIKVKKMKSNFNSLIFNFKKDNPKLSNIKKVNKNNKNENNSYIQEKDNKIVKKKPLQKKNNNINNTNLSKKNKNQKINKLSFKNIKINGIDKEYFKSFIISKYSRSFVKVPFTNEEKNNLFTVKKKERKFTKSFEDKNFIKDNNKSNKNFQNIKRLKINSKNNKSPQISKKKLMNLKNNRYQMTDYYSSFNNSLPITINKIKSSKNKVENINSLDRKNSHNILITNININLFKEDENKAYLKNLEMKTEENNIDLERIFLLEQNVLKILSKINNYISCDEECFNWISFYFGINFYLQILNLFKKEDNYKKIFNYIKLEIVCYFLCYDISLNQNFSKASFLLKAIMNILHENYLIIIKYFLHLYTLNNKDDNNNNLWINKLNKIIETELKMNLISQDMNEDSITSLIYNTIKNVNNYYEMIIDNLYLTKKETNNYIFPNCLNIKENDINSISKSNIISLFFSQVNKSLDSYTFENMKLFFYLYLNNQNYYNKKQKLNKEEKMENSKINKNFLSSENQRLKYTLLINLDETLIYNDKNTIILRPNLFNFLSKVKEMYEIIAFSFDSNSIIDKALELIENKSKYFDYVLYTDQLNINYNGKLIKDLNNLGRDIKNIIVIDTKNHIHKKYKNNLILIKGFYGDVSKDINLLKILGYLLENIKNDNFQDDIRIRIKKFRNIIKTYLYNNI